MEVAYRMSRDDYRRCQRLARSRKTFRDLTKIAYLPWLASTIFVLLVLAFCVGRGSIDERAFMVALLAYMWGIYTVEIGGWILRRRYWDVLMADGSVWLDDVRLKVDGDGLEGQTTKYSWRAFSDVSEHADFILLWFGPARYFPVPLRAFTSQKLRRDFVSLARERVGWRKDRLPE